MAYRAQTSTATRVTNLGFVLLLHVAVIFGLVQMLKRTEIPQLLQSFKTTILEQQAVKTAEPPPPPPALEKPPPVYVPPPQFSVETPTTSSTAIQAVTGNRVLPKSRTSNPEPDFPAAEKHLHHEGIVLLEISVDATGHPTDVKVLKTSGFPALDESARSTVLTRWRFTPGMLEGQPAPMVTRLNVQFRCRVGTEDRCSGW
jgi:protein TonB